MLKNLKISYRKGSSSGISYKLIKFLRTTIGVIPSILILSAFVFTAIFAGSIAPYSPKEISLSNSFLPPVLFGGIKNYILGTDLLGRDILSRIVYGARVSLVVAVTSIFFSGVIGCALGIIAGYKGGWIDSVISRTVDVMMGFPTLLVALIIAISLGGSLYIVIFIIVLVYWARYARLARGETLKIREKDYVTLARTAGCSDFVIILKHILPNIFNSILVLATFNVGTSITLEASLSFLGAGVPPPTPSWGNMIADGRGFLVEAWWVTMMPGLVITLVVLSANLFGDWLRDKLDPKLRDL